MFSISIYGTIYLASLTNKAACKRSKCFNDGVLYLQISPKKMGFP